MRKDRWQKIYFNKVPRLKSLNDERWATTCGPGCCPLRGRATSPKPPSQTFLSRTSWTFSLVFLTFQVIFSRFWPPCEWYFAALCSCVFNCLSLFFVFSLCCHFSCSVLLCFQLPATACAALCFLLANSCVSLCFQLVASAFHTVLHGQRCMATMGSGTASGSDLHFVSSF